jgi:hypothetical protein
MWRAKKGPAISVHLKKRRREGPGWRGKISPEARSYAVDGRDSDLLEGGSLCPVL